MKDTYLTKLILVLIIGLIVVTSCEKKYVDDYEPYDPSSTSAATINLKYNTPLITFPAIGLIVSDTPTFTLDGVYKFLIDTIISVDSASFNYNSFSIDEKVGAIYYDNSGGTISMGTFSVNVAVLNIKGVVIFDSAFKLIIQDVPIILNATPDFVSVDALETGVISNLSFEPVGTPVPPVSVSSYSIDPAVTGFTVNDAGEVIKGADTEPGEYELSFLVTTNYGQKHFDDVLTVNVSGSAPTLHYVQQDGLSLLEGITLSPWTAYSSHTPVLEGITAEGWSLILPDGAPQELINGLSIENDGSVVINADQNIPEGDYSIGVSVTSSGVEFDFNDMFVFYVETRWDETPVFSETFDYAQAGGGVLEPPFSSTHVNAGVPDKKFNAVNFTKDDPQRDLHSARLLYGKDGSYDAALVLALSNDGTWKNVRIKFGQFYGYGTAALELFERSLWYSYNNETLEGTFTPSNWSQIMANDDPDWLTENLWGDAEPYNDGDLPSTPYRELVGLDALQSDIFICWHFFTEGSADTGSQWFIDDVYVQAAMPYGAEEW